MLERVLGEVSIDSPGENFNEIKRFPVPGIKHTHYSPDAEMIIIQGDLDKTVAKIKELKLSCEERQK